MVFTMSSGPQTRWLHKVLYRLQESQCNYLNLLFSYAAHCVDRVGNAKIQPHW